MRERWGGGGGKDEEMAREKGGERTEYKGERGDRDSTRESVSNWILTSCQKTDRQTDREIERQREREELPTTRKRKRKRR